MSGLESRVGFVMLAWNLPEIEAGCVASIHAQSDPNWQLVIVDNGSAPPFDVPAALVGDPRVSLVRNESNVGYAQGMNVGLAHLGTDFMVPLNSDVTLDPEFVARLRPKLDTSCRDRIGALAPLVFRGSPDECRGVESKGWFLRSRFSLISDERTADGTGVFSGSGACTAYLADCIRDVCRGGYVFDPSYFAYGEDVDLLFRIHYAGWRCVYAEDLVAWHLGSAYGGEAQSALDKPEWLQTHILRNRVRNIVKYLSWRDLVWFGPGIAVTEIAMLLNSALRGRPPFATWRNSYGSVWSEREGLLAARREILSTRTMATRDLVGLMRGI